MICTAYSAIGAAAGPSNVNGPVLSPNRSAGTPALSSDRQQQIRHLAGLGLEGHRQVAPAFVLPRTAAEDCQRQIHVRVDVRVAEPGAVEQQRVIEQRAVAVGRRSQLLEERREQLRLIGVHLGELRDLLRIVAVVREPVVRLGDADFRIGPA